MSIHRITARQREWSEMLSAGILAALISCCVLVSSAFSQQSGEAEVDNTPPPAEEDAQTPEDQEFTGPPTTHVLGMSIADARPQGAIVMKVDPLGPAADAGVKKGDIITEVAGRKTQPYDKFLAVLRDMIEKRTKGDSVNIALLRDGKTGQLTLTERVGSEERKDDVKKLAEEYSEDQRAERQMEKEEEDDAESLADAVMEDRDRNGPEEGADTASLSELLGGGVQRPADQDYDYYFGSGGMYGGALTSGQQSEYDRLMRLQDRNGLTNAQRQRLDELTALEFSRFSDLDPLDERDATELEELMARRRNGDELSSDDRARMRQMIGRRYASEGDYRRQIQELEQMSERGELNNREQMRLDMLREMGPDAGQRASDSSLQQLRELAGDELGALPPQQLQRLQQLARQSGELSPQDMAELRQLRLQSQSQVARRLRNEYQAAQQLMQSGRQLTPQQANRFQQLQRNLGRFSAGAPRGAVPYPAAANQAQGGNVGPQQSGNSGSGIGLGGQGGPSSPANGSGIGTANGPGIGSAPSGGAGGGGGSGNQ